MIKEYIALKEKSEPWLRFYYSTPKAYICTEGATIFAERPCRICQPQQLHVQNNVHHSH